MSGGAFSSAKAVSIGSSVAAISSFPVVGDFYSSNVLVDDHLYSGNQPNIQSVMAFSPCSSPITSQFLSNTSFYGYSDNVASSAIYTGISAKMSSSNNPTVEQTWLIWLWQHVNQFGTPGEDGYYYDQGQLYDAWLAFCSSWNETMGKKPSWEEWLAWFMSNGGSHIWGSGENVFNAHFYVPIGSILPLLMLVLSYIAYIFFKSLKINRE